MLPEREAAEIGGGRLRDTGVVLFRPKTMAFEESEAESK
jgi:hypothetical protein